MDVDTPTFTPRLRMSRHSLVHDGSSNLASTSEAGPSRLPNYSQILDLDMKDIPLSDGQFSSSELNTPKITATTAATRSDNPAAVLRALLSRLPAHPPSPTQSYALSVQGGTERESDFDTFSESNAAPSIAQESLKHVFSKALRDPGNTPQKAMRRRNSIDASEVEASPRVEKERATNKGKRRSMSDDEVENSSQTISRRDIRLKSTSRPVTMEFLRERFSDSHNQRTSIEPQRSPTISSKHDSSNDTATILRDLNSSQATPPAATSTPQQSMRLSTNSRFQFHSNLLDQDSEMQKAIEGLDSYDEGVTNGQASVSRAFNSSKTLQTSPVLRHQSSKSSSKSKPTPSSSQKLTRDQTHSQDDLRTPSQRRERLHAETSKSSTPGPQLNSHHNETNVISDSNRTKPSKDRSSMSHSELHSEVHSTSSRLSPLPRIEHYRHHSPSSGTNSPADSLRNHDDDYVDVVYERQRNWNSPRPIWHKPPSSPNLSKGRGSSPSHLHSASTPSPPTTNGRIRTNSFRTSKHFNEHHHDHRSHADAFHIPATKEQPSRPFSPSSNEQSSPTPSRTSSLQAIDNTYRTNDPSLRPASRSFSPPLSSSKERNGLPVTRIKTLSSSRKQGSNSSFMDQEEEDHPLFNSNTITVTPIQNNNSRERHLSCRNSAEPATPRNEDNVRDRDTESDGLRETDFSSQGEVSKLGVVAPSLDISEDSPSRSGTPLGTDDLPQENGFGSTPDHTAQTATTTFPLTPTQNKASQSLRNGFKTLSPPKALPDLPTPSSSDETDHDSPRSNRTHRNIQSGFKQLATPKPPGGWLNTPKPSREVVEQSDNVTQSDDDTPLATDRGLPYLKAPARVEATHGFQSFSNTPKPPGGWVSTPARTPALIPNQSMPVDSPLDIPERNRGLLTPVASLSKGSKLEPKTPAAPGAWLATPAVKKSILKVRFEPEVSTSPDKLMESAKHSDPSFDSSISAMNGLDIGGDGLQRTEQWTEQLSSKSPPSPRRKKSPKSPKVRVLDAFGREQEPGVSNQEWGHEIDKGSPVEDTETAATLNYSTSSRGELLSRIRNGLDDLVVGIDDFDKDDQALSIDHDRVQQLTTISRRVRGLRERLYSQADSSRSLLSSTLDTKTSWFPGNPKIYIFLIILQLSLLWLMYRISMNWAHELWLNSYYDPFNPELYLYIFKSDASLHVLRSEGARTTTPWSSLVGHIWNRWIHIIGSMQFRFWPVLDKGAVLQYDNAWTPT